MSELPILLEIANGVGTITLNRPDTGNAIDPDSARHLLDALRVCETDKCVRALLITGAGRLFSVGGDVRAMADAGDDAPAMLEGLINDFHCTISHLSRTAKPVVIAVNGAAAGAGFSLAMMGDFVLASEAAHFASAYGAIGLTADGGLSWTLPRLVGLRMAQDILLGNRRVAAEEALTMGLVSRIVSNDGLLDESAALARRLATGPTFALGMARRLLWESGSHPLAHQLDRERFSMVAASRGPDAREGLAAFFEKRAANFTGE